MFGKQNIIQLKSDNFEFMLFRLMMCVLGRAKSGAAADLLCGGGRFLIELLIMNNS